MQCEVGIKVHSSKFISKRISDCSRTISQEDYTFLIESLITFALNSRLLYPVANMTPPLECLKHGLKLQAKTKLLNIVLICSQSFPFQETVKPVSQDKNLEPSFVPVSFSQGRFNLLSNLADSVFKIYPAFHYLPSSPLLSYPHHHCLLSRLFQ